MSKKNKRKKIKKNNLFYLVLIIAIISFVFLVIFVFLIKSSVLEVRTIGTYLEIIEGKKIGVGFNKGEKVLNFSFLNPGSSVRRAIILTNNYNIDIIVVTIVNGNIKEFIYPETGIKIKQNETKELSVSAIIPENAKDRKSVV